MSDRYERVAVLVRDGKNSREVAAELGLTAAQASMLCFQVREKEGLPLVSARKATKRVMAKNDMSLTGLKRMQAECREHLGDALVTKLDADDLESAELVRLHAALRCVLVDAEEFLSVVKARLAEIRRGR